jgi:1-acyl-sn-glycerol-3-phosphate acyltransferase
MAHHPNLLEKAREHFIQALVPADINAAIEKIPNHINEMGYDDWGMRPETIKLALGFIKWFYDVYFRVEVSGAEQIPAGRCLIVANHGGQLPFDGLLLALACGLEANPPRIVRGMVERWFPTIPYINILFSRCGQVVGDPINCRNLLQNDEAIMVFPEGVRGSGKPIWQRYQLQRFGTGFMRLALETDSPIIPAAIIGAEETYPGLYNVKFLSRLLNIPYCPITPQWPLLGPLGALPLPMKIRIHFGAPMHFEGDFDAPEAEMEPKVNEVRAQLQTMIEAGRKKRGWRYLW